MNVLPVEPQNLGVTDAGKRSQGEEGDMDRLRVREQVAQLLNRKDFEVGGSFADTARALGARLAAARPVQYAGIAFIAGAVALFYFGWPKIGACAVGAGVGMIVLSMVLPGNERWILGGFVAFFVVASAALLIGWYKGKDENRNHVPDWAEHFFAELKRKS
jgi:hypothetical protein